MYGTVLNSITSVLYKGHKATQVLKVFREYKVYKDLKAIPVRKGLREPQDYKVLKEILDRKDQLD